MFVRITCSVKDNGGVKFGEAGVVAIYSTSRQYYLLPGEYKFYVMIGVTTHGRVTVHSATT